MKFKTRKEIKRELITDIRMMESRYAQREYEDLEDSKAYARMGDQVRSELAFTSARVWGGMSESARDNADTLEMEQ